MIYIINFVLSVDVCFTIYTRHIICVYSLHLIRIREYWFIIMVSYYANGSSSVACVHVCECVRVHACVCVCVAMMCMYQRELITRPV